MMIPQFEIDQLLRIYAEAVECAAEGSPLAGYMKLDLGLSWAESPPVDPLTGEVEEPEPWAEELIDTYRHAILRYLEVCPMIRPLVCLSDEPRTLDPVRQRARFLSVQSEELRGRARRARAHSVRLREDSRRVRAAPAPEALVR